MLTSLERRLRMAQSLRLARCFLAFDPALARCLCRLGRSPLPRLDCRTADQFDEAVERILTVAPLRAMTLRGDDQNAVAREPGADEPLKPRAHTFAGSDGDRRTSKRSWTAVASLLTFCPPGPDARTKLSSISRSSMLIWALTRIMPQRASAPILSRSAAGR